MWAIGTKGTTGPATATAGKYSYTDSSTNTNVLVRTSSQTYSASWFVGGLGATNGVPSCDS